MDIARRGGRVCSALGRLDREMNELFGRLVGVWSVWPEVACRGGMLWPAIDVAEGDDAVVVKAELPGLNRDEIDISIEAGTLRISGEKRESTEEKADGRRYVERRYGSFRRVIALPAGVEAEKIAAEYEDGVLTVRVPKAEEAKPRRIPVRS